MFRIHVNQALMNFNSINSVILGEKPYTCLFCPKTFRDQTSRHKHIQKFHPTRVSEYEVYRKEHLRDEMKRVETDLETTLYECDKGLWAKQRFQGMGRPMKKKKTAKPVELEEEVDDPPSPKEDNDEEGSSGDIEFVSINENQEDESDDEYILFEMDDSGESDEDDEMNVDQDEEGSDIAEEEEVEFIEEDD